MKKLLLGAIATAAILFGFASCGSDLADKVTEPLYLAGDLNSYKNGGKEKEEADNKPRNIFKMVKGSETTQEYEFVYHNDMTNWGGGNGKANFKICSDKDSWKLDWGGKQDKAISLSVNATEFLELEHRDATNSNPGNIVVEDLLDGETYKIILEYDAPSTKVGIKITGNKPDFPSLRFVVVDDEGKTVDEYPLERKGTDYTYAFTKTTSGTFKGYLTNGYLYWGADGMVTKTSDIGEYFEGEYEANKACNVKVTVDPSNLAAVPSVKVGATSILADSYIEGPFNKWNATQDPLVFVDETTSTFEFETTDDSGEFEFSILVNKGVWWPRWYAGTTDKTEVLKPLVAKKTIAPTVEGTSLKPLYEKAELEYGKDNNIKVEGLPFVPGKKFVLTIKITDESKNELSISCAPKDGETFTADDYTKEPPKTMVATIKGQTAPVELTKDKKIYTYTLEGEALAGVGTSLEITKLTYGNENGKADYGVAAGTTITLKTPVALAKNGGAITVAIDTEKYKSYKFEVDATDESAIKMTVSATEKAFVLYMVGAPNYTTDNVFTQMSTLIPNKLLGYTFTYKTTMSDKWGSPPDGVAFKLALGDGVWDGAFAGCDITVDGVYVDAKADASDNAKIKALEDNTPYTVLADISDQEHIKVSVIKGLQLFLVGAPNYTGTNVFDSMVSTGNGIQTYTFTYKTAMSANWGSPANGVAFKLALGDGVWDGAFAGCEVTGTYAEAEAGADGNATASGLTDETTYTIIADTAEDGKVKVAIIEGAQLFLVGAPNYTTDNVFDAMVIDMANGVQTYTFTYKTAMSAKWGSPPNGVAFKLALGDGVWAGAFAGCEVTGTYAEAEAGADGNATASGLTDETTYVITAKQAAGGVKIKIEAK